MHEKKFILNQIHFKTKHFFLDTRKKKFILKQIHFNSTLCVWSLLSQETLTLAKTIEVRIYTKVMIARPDVWVTIFRTSKAVDPPIITA